MESYKAYNKLPAGTPVKYTNGKGEVVTGTVIKVWEQTSRSQYLTSAFKHDKGNYPNSIHWCLIKVIK
jgi:surface antigen